jgi:hypothetical protein
LNLCSFIYVVFIIIDDCVIILLLCMYVWLLLDEEALEQMSTGFQIQTISARG